jgi:hypothetical protein
MANGTSKLIDGFDKLTKQQLFDISRKHLEGTGQCSVRTHDGLCVYSGTGCGAAPFIKPEHRRDADRYGSWRSLIKQEGFASTHESNFVVALQRAHDSAALTARESKYIDDGSRNDYWRQLWWQNMVLIGLAVDLDISGLE